MLIFQGVPFDIFCVYVFCSANGVVTCVYYSKGDDERKFFKPATVCRSPTGQNEELCRRLGMGLALDAASVHNGMKVLAKHFGSELSEEMNKHSPQDRHPKDSAASLSRRQGSGYRDRCPHQLERPGQTGANQRRRKSRRPSKSSWRTWKNDWWFGPWWFGFLGSLYKRDCYLGAPPESQTINSKCVDFLKFTL